jgi:hypothetical protein
VTIGPSSSLVGVQTSKFEFSFPRKWGLALRMPQHAQT